jgi:hypothetical protein
LPTANINDPLRVVVNEAAGAPDEALAPFLPPIAPEPLTPEVSVPVNVMIVIEAATLCDSVAWTVAFTSAAPAKALQTSAVPNCPLVRRTKAHVNPPPETPLTMIPDDFASVEMKASRSSLADVVENEGEVMLALEVERSTDFV